MLFVYGQDSALVPQESLAEVEAANRQAELVGIPNDGHMIPFENLPDFVTAVLQFTERTSHR